MPNFNIRINLFRKGILFFLSAISVLLFSCQSQKKTIYLQEEKGVTQNKKDSVSSSNYLPIYKVNDLLKITVTSLDLDASKPFNKLGIKINDDGKPVASDQVGYLIDSNGMIDFPVVGKILIAGLNRDQAVQLLKEKIKPFVADPIIDIRIGNYIVTVLGDVKNPGTIKIENEKITLLEALGYTGDLNSTGVRKNVLVIREEKGERKEFRVDLTSKKLYQSPVYYLQQNDVVYVQPNRVKTTAAYTPTNIGVILSVISIIFVTLNFVTK